MREKAAMNRSLTFGGAMLIFDQIHHSCTFPWTHHYPQQVLGLRKRIGFGYAE
jgi:hypothetical protein